jgi:hypothetical protein
MYWSDPNRNPIWLGMYNHYRRAWFALKLATARRRGLSSQWLLLDEFAGKPCLPCVRVPPAVSDLVRWGLPVSSSLVMGGHSAARGNYRKRWSWKYLKQLVPCRNFSIRSDQMFIFLWIVKDRNSFLWILVSYSYVPKGTKVIFPMIFLSFNIPARIPCSKRPRSLYLQIYLLTCILRYILHNADDQCDYNFPCHTR